jgi:hypothetical protein
MTDTTLTDMLNRVDEQMALELTQPKLKGKHPVAPAPQVYNEAVKNDAGKLPWHLLPSDAIDDVLEVLQYGAAKYGERNWERGMEWNRPFSALMRHMWSWWRGETYDPESGKPHLAHAACCVLFLVAYERRCVGVDNRVK